MQDAKGIQIIQNREMQEYVKQYLYMCLFQFLIRRKVPVMSLVDLNLHPTVHGQAQQSFENQETVSSSNGTM